MNARTAPTRSRGIAATEFAVVLPFLLMMMLGLWEVGRMVEVNQILNNAVREGAREAASGAKTSTSSASPANQVQAGVATYMSNAGIPITDTSGAFLSGVSVTVTVAGSSSTDATQGNKGDPIAVNLQVPYNVFRWTTVRMFVTNPNYKMSATSTWPCCKDAPILSVNTTIPASP